jgi:hypothetical protein
VVVAEQEEEKEKRLEVLGVGNLGLLEFAATHVVTKLNEK